MKEYGELGMPQSTVAAGNKTNEKPIDFITFPSKQISNCLPQCGVATTWSLMFKCGLNAKQRLQL